ncbi:MBL fold metallo-hydrolase [Aquihabitans sp. G128]|uniref:alkyl/aryl-sulfatase n=1 Tax=Aquihabitans sp. G128 TaxID=2849779 RepID=UPI001C24FA77|nr:alkyl sulfatase dimerization domain-containing protein [Aquihabitans sp. G128]QXC61778.1 MBL fold metallo-hydrolase [Aquihabitans sp. G128]
MSDPSRPDQPDLSAKAARAATAAANRLAAELPFLGDDGDHQRAVRGRLAEPEGPVASGSGWHVWDLGQYHFLDQEPPPEVHPSLWRQARLNNEAGLFEVAPGFHQVRGLDLANLTVVEGTEGRIVIDPLTSAQTARAALDLVDRHLGPRPVTAVIYTHSHVDHFAGVRGVVDEADVVAGRVRVIAPSGFLEAAVSENVVAGNAMTRRASYMYGALLPRGPRGHVDAGLGKGVPLLAEQGLIAPTEEVAETGTELVVDGVRITFQVTPDTEAPSEMNFHFPDHRVLCMAENCTCTLHNLYTPRGAPVRDALAWSKYLQEAIELYGDTSDVLFASHHWPTWGRQELVAHLGRQRDTYRFLHDQTLRLANHGLVAAEIAEELRLPPALEGEPSSRGYYGTVSHNAKAVYQRYLGWFDGNPAHLQPHPPVAAAERYVDAVGGADALLAKARVSFDAGDFRWVAELVNHLVFADPENLEARALQADALEQLGYQAESAPWRDFYLTGAQELRHGHPTSRPGSGPGADTVAAMTTELLFDYLGIRIDGLRAAERSWHLDVVVTDRSERWRLGVERGALHAVAVPAEQVADDVGLEVAGPHAAVAALVFGSRPLADLEGDGDLVVTGDRDALLALLAVLDRFSLMFPIVTP